MKKTASFVLYPPKSNPKGEVKYISFHFVADYEIKRKIERETTEIRIYPAEIWMIEDIMTCFGSYEKKKIKLFFRNEHNGRMRDCKLSLLSLKTNKEKHRFSWIDYSVFRRNMMIFGFVDRKKEILK